MRSLAAMIGVVALLQQPTIRVDVQLQQMMAIVRNSSGQLVRHLTPAELTIEEDGVPQAIAHFSEDSDISVSLGILIDVSGSMGTRSGGLSRLAAAEGATRVLLHLMKPRDEFLLMSFSNDLQVRGKFTEDPEIIESEMKKLTPMGGTNLFPSVAQALQKMKQARHRNRALVLISDGIAGGDLESLSRSVRNGEVAVYTFGLASSSEFGRAPIQGLQAGPQAIMNTLAEESGGRSKFFDVADLDATLVKMVDFIRDIAADLRGQYTLDYYTKHSGGVIRVRAADSSYVVRARRNALELGP